MGPFFGPVWISSTRRTEIKDLTNKNGANAEDASLSFIDRQETEKER